MPEKAEVGSLLEHREQTFLVDAVEAAFRQELPHLIDHPPYHVLGAVRRSRRQCQATRQEQQRGATEHQLSSMEEGERHDEGSDSPLVSRPEPPGGAKGPSNNLTRHR